jgi:hypothetical protein
VDELVRVTHGLWRPPASVTDLAGRAAALLSKAPAGSVVGGRAAAQLHGLWLFEEPVERIDILLRTGTLPPEAHAGSRRRELRGRRRKVVADEIDVVDGLPVTSAARTWVDLAEELSMPDLIASGDSVLRGPVSLEEIELMVKRARHRRGVVAARTAVPLLDRRSRSRPESHLRYAIVSAGLPKPEVNEHIYNGLGEWLAEPDLSYADVRLAIEYNGALHAQLRRMRRDMTRGVDVGIRGGWLTVAFGPAEVFGHPEQVAAYVRLLRHERAALVRSPFGHISSGHTPSGPH